MGAMLRACLGCGRAVARLVEGRCPRCLACDPRRLARAVTGSWSPERNRSRQGTWSRQIRARAGNQCEAVIGGARCPVTERLQAHHLRDGWELEDGVLLCTAHHRLLDPMAR